MNATEHPFVIDYERLAITARSASANLDVLTDEGMSTDDAVAVRRHAEVLADETVAPNDAQRHGVALRGLLAAAPGRTASVLVAWLDDALAPTD